MDRSTDAVIQQGQPSRLPHIRLDPATDRDLMAWLQELEKEPQGVRGHRYKEILRLGLRAAGWLLPPLESSASPPAASGAAHPPLDTEVLLSDIRRVVEAALESGLNRGGMVLSQGPVTTGGEEEDILGSMIDDFLLGD